jgi:hypothetical protein
VDSAYLDDAYAKIRDRMAKTPGANVVAIGNALTMPSVGPLQAILGAAGGVGGLHALKNPAVAAVAKKYNLGPVSAALIGSVIGQTAGSYLFNGKD